MSKKKKVVKKQNKKQKSKNEGKEQNQNVQSIEEKKDEIKTEITEVLEADVEGQKEENIVEDKKEENSVQNSLMKNQDIEEIHKQIKEKKKIPEEIQKRIYKRLAENIGIAILSMTYILFIIMGFYNIERSVFLTDLRVFSIAILVISLLIFENAYKKDSGRITIYGIEILFIAIITMGLIYLAMMQENNFVSLVAAISFIIGIYYVGKSIFLYVKMRRQYFLKDIKKMIKK